MDPCHDNPESGEDSIMLSEIAWVRQPRELPLAWNRGTKPSRLNNWSFYKSCWLKYWLSVWLIDFYSLGRVDIVSARSGNRNRVYIRLAVFFYWGFAELVNAQRTNVSTSSLNDKWQLFLWLRKHPKQKPRHEPFNFCMDLKHWLLFWIARIRWSTGFCTDQLFG